MDSWKAIASYLKRDVRTVQRWEANLGLPVHRLRGDKGGSAYAYKEELDAWWRERGQHPSLLAADRAGELALEPNGASDAEAHPEMSTVPAEPGSRGLWRTLAALLLLAGSVLLATFFLWSGRPIQRASTRGKTKLAVLPFQNLGGDPAKEYFSDGMTEEMIARLSQIQPDRLGVIARASSMVYKNSPKALPQICRELGVDYVLEGSVLLANNRTRINTELIDCTDQTQVWADSAERDLADIMALQNGVAQGVAGNVRLVLAPPTHTVGDVSPEAYQAYLKGLYMWNKLSPEGNQSAVDFFRFAIQKDPGYAKPYAGLARCYIMLGLMGAEPPERVLSDARSAAARALSLDDAEPDAHSAMADIAMEYDWDWLAAEREYRRALELNPNLVVAHIGYWRLLLLLRRQGEASSELKAAQALDPVSTVTGQQIVQDLNFARRFDDSIVQAKEFLKLHPDSVLVRFYLADAYQQKAMFSQAVETYLNAMELAGESESRIAVLREAYRRANIRGFWCKKLELDMKPDAGHYVRAYDVAYDYAALGDRDHSFQWLDKSFLARDGGTLELNLQPVFDVLRHDPRFGQLLQKMNLPQ